MERSSIADDTLSLPIADYEAADVLVVSEPERLRALADELRTRIVVLLRERARSISELADELELPKGTVGHHVKVLEKAGLIRVVRTRQVRALTERYYGRVARLFLLKGDEPARAVARLSPDDARRFAQRLERLVADFCARDSDDGEPYELTAGLYRAEAPRA